LKRYRPPSAEENEKLAALGKELAPQWGTHFGPVAAADTFPYSYHV